MRLAEKLITESLDVISIMQQLKESGAHCKYKRWTWLNQKTGKVSRFYCNSWEYGECRSVIAERVESYEVRVRLIIS